MKDNQCVIFSWRVVVWLNHKISQVPANAQDSFTIDGVDNDKTKIDNENKILNFFGLSRFKDINKKDKDDQHQRFNQKSSLHVKSKTNSNLHGVPKSIQSDLTIKIKGSQTANQED